MAGILPEGEKLRNAIRWVSQRRVEEPNAPVVRLVDEAGLKFDLSPAEQQTLFALLTGASAPRSG